MFDPRYEAQVRLLLRCLPAVERQACFAMKGGTALNLFLRDMPRLSVDIDLTYLPLKLRVEALEEIQGALFSIRDDLGRNLPGARVGEHRVGGYVVKLTVSNDSAVVKLEPNLTLRGAVHPPSMLDLCPTAQECYQSFVAVRTLAAADLYGGKLCAALDRQHPRDLFDVKLLLDDTGITPDVRRAFVVYLAGHDRPMLELLSPRLQDIRGAYDSQFKGMTRIDVSLEDLREVQRELPKMLVRALDDDEREFLVSLKRGEPEWGRLGIEHLDRLPALQWKLINVRRMEPEKNKRSLDLLVQTLRR